MLNLEHFHDLTLCYSQNINEEVLSFGSVRITSANSTRSFILDIEKTYRHDDEVVCQMQNVDQMIEDNTFEGESQFDLTEVDLFDGELEISVWCGDSSDPTEVKPDYGVLTVVTCFGVKELNVVVE